MSRFKYQTGRNFTFFGISVFEVGGGSFSGNLTEEEFCVESNCGFGSVGGAGFNFCGTSSFVLTNRANS